MRTTRRGFIALSGAPLLAQEPPSTTFKVDVNLVTVAFVVRDRAGKLAPNLEQADFEILEDGAPQTIRSFRRDEDTPLTLGLVLDYSPSQEQYEQENIYSAVTFFRSVLRPEDRAFIAAFGNRIQLIQDSTASLDELESSLKQVRRRYDRTPRLGPNERRDGGSAVLDAIYWPVREKLRDIPGRKALIMIGDGKENASRMTMVDVIDQLQSSDVLFYGLSNEGDNRGRQIRNQMPLVADETGGRVFDTQKTPMREAFREIEQELRTLYTVGYNSSKPERDGRYRKIAIRPKSKEFVVRARPGYYAR